MSVGPLDDLKALGSALAQLDDAREDAGLIRFVASALHGVANGLEDAGDVASGRAVRFSTAEIVRLLVSGEWREVAGVPS